MTRHSLLFWPVVLVLSAVACFPQAAASPQAPPGVAPAAPHLDGRGTRLNLGDALAGFIKLAPVPPETLSPWPAWVKRGNCLSTGEMGTVLFGIGCAQYSSEKSPSELDALAENRAEAEVLALYEQVSELWHDCVRTMRNADGHRAASKEENEFSALALDFPLARQSQVRVIDHWTDPKN